MRYVAERGSGSNGTAYNRRDYEVLDTNRPFGRRIVCRAARKDAEMITNILNLQSGNLYEALKHGDNAHRQWLREAIDAAFAGQPVPAPYDAKAKS